MRIEKLFPSALSAVENNFKEEIKSGIPNEYKGYISSFGAMVIQNGLLPAVAFFDKKDSNTTESREKIVRTIEEVLAKYYGVNVGKNELINYLRKKNIDDIKEYERKILDISIAVKLALRTFEFKKGE